MQRTARKVVGGHVGQKIGHEWFELRGRLTSPESVPCHRRRRDRHLPEGLDFNDAHHRTAVVRNGDAAEPVALAEQAPQSLL
jgi:hypothetical protein